MKDRTVFGFAWLWERWKDRASGQTIQSCTIVTTTPNEVCAPIHDRMPDPRAQRLRTMVGGEPTEPPHLMMMLKPYLSTAMEAYPVSSRVGSVKNTDAPLFEPLEGNSAQI